MLVKKMLVKNEIKEGEKLKLNLPILSDVVDKVPR